MVGLKSHFRMGGKEEVCGNGTLVQYKNKAGTEVPVPNEGNKEAGMVGINSHFRKKGKKKGKAKKLYLLLIHLLGHHSQ